MPSKPVTANGASESIPMFPGENIVTIEAATLATGATLIIQTRADADGQWCEHQDPEDDTTPAQLDDADGVSGGGYGRQFVINGPGAVRAYAASFSTSTGVVLRVAKSSIQ